MKEAVDMELRAGSCSKRHGEAIRLSEWPALCLDWVVQGQDGVGTLAGAFLFEEVDSCSKHKEKVG